MAPLNNVAHWYSREQDSLEEVDPHYVVYVICEGQNTEDYYFSALFTLLERQKAPHVMEAVYCEKTREDASSSHPKKLLELAINKMEEDDFEEGDEVAIVFDADVYRDSGDEYAQLLGKCEECGVRPVVTFPSFEVFLILHVEDAIERYIRPKESEIIRNKKVNRNKSFIKALCSEATGCNPEHSGVRKLAQHYETAIEAERELNQDARRALGVVTSTVGQFIQYLSSD